jgi:hypothetical protein
MRHSIRVVACGRKLRRHRLRLIVLFAGVLYVSHSFSHAASITFRFDATIETLFPGVSFDSGLTFALDDLVSGEFTYDPSAGSGATISAVQPYIFSFSANGQNLTSPSFQMTANDDALVLDSEAGSIVDQLELRGAGISHVNGGAGANADPLQSTFSMDLWAGAGELIGEAPVLDRAYFPSEADIWNQFVSWRNLTVILRNGNGGTVGFSAKVGHFVQIPEPSVLLLILLMLPMIGAKRRRRSKHS